MTDELTALRVQLAASEAREMQLREAIESAVTSAKLLGGVLARKENGTFTEEDSRLAAHLYQNIDTALALPADTTALREVCLRVARVAYFVPYGVPFNPEAIVDEVLGK